MKVCLTIVARQRWADAIAKLGVRAVCVSYPQLQRRSSKFVEEYLGTIAASGAWVLLDSGARSFAPADDEEADELVRQYIEFVSTWRAYLGAWTEMDATEVVGPRKVRAWREWWREAELADALVIGHAGLEDLEGYRAVGVSGTAADLRQFWARNTGRVKERGLLVFGRGTSSVESLRYPWYCLDTTSWSAWGRWGHIYFWDEERGKLEIFKQPEGDEEAKAAARDDEFTRRNVSEEIERLGLTLGIASYDNEALDLWNMSQWAHLQNRMEFGEAYDESTGGMVPVQRGKVVLLSQYGEKMGNKAPQALQVGRECNGCSVRDKCPMFQADSECELSSLRPIKSKADILDAVHQVLAIQFDRVQFGALSERLNGGALDESVTEQLKQFMKLLKDMRELSSVREEVTIKASGGQGGIVSQIFGGLLSGPADDPLAKEERDVIDVSAK